jgi:hypothetical protein
MQTCGVGGSDNLELQMQAAGLWCSSPAQQPLAGVLRVAANLGPVLN